MDPLARGVLAVTSLALGLLPVGMVFGSAPPSGVGATTLAVASGLGALSAAVMWLTTFPTRTQSVAYAVVSTASVAAAVLAQSDPGIALLGCTAFVTVSGYIALFHTATLMSLNLLVVLIVPIVPAAELASTHGIIYAACGYGAVLVVNIAMPFAIQLIVHAFGADLVKADHDSLTGLLNRRAFYERVISLATTQPAGMHLVLAMLDLDRFKQLNDAHGHTVGDQALVEVARALREQNGATALVGRVGGEEFLVADAFARPRPDTIGRGLCAAVAALPHPLTASVGTTTIACKRILTAADSRALITSLINAADMAMYEAKRNGGNQSRHLADPVDEVSEIQ